MKRTRKELRNKGRKIQNLNAVNEQGQPQVWGKQSGGKDLLLRHPNFVAKSINASFESPPLACEARKSRK